MIDVEHLQRQIGDRCLINDFTYSFSPEDRVGFIGPNGMGKSTLLDLLSGRQQPDAGSVVRGETVVIGRFDQHSEDLKPELKVIEVIQDVAERIDLGQGNSLTPRNCWSASCFRQPNNTALLPNSQVVNAGGCISAGC